MTIDQMHEKARRVAGILRGTPQKSNVDLPTFESERTVSVRVYPFVDTSVCVSVHITGAIEVTIAGASDHELTGLRDVLAPRLLARSRQG